MEKIVELKIQTEIFLANYLPMMQLGFFFIDLFI